MVRSLAIGAEGAVLKVVRAQNCSKTLFVHLSGDAARRRSGTPSQLHHCRSPGPLTPTFPHMQPLAKG